MEGGSIGAVTSAADPFQPRRGRSPIVRRIRIRCLFFLFFFVIIRRNGSSTAADDINNHTSNNNNNTTTIIVCVCFCFFYCYYYQYYCCFFAAPSWRVPPFAFPERWRDDDVNGKGTGSNQEGILQGDCIPRFDLCPPIPSPDLVSGRQ